MATEVAVRVKVGVKVGDRDRVSLLLLRLPLAAQLLHARVAAAVARRRGGASGGATPGTLPPTGLLAIDLCGSSPAPPIFL